MSESETTSYRQILKASALIGGSSAFNVLLGIVRTKVLAVLIGTAGMGMFGALGSVTAMVGSVASMGISMSGVREIAKSAGTMDRQKIARTALVLRRTSLVTGLLGMSFLLVFCGPISQATFGDRSFAGSLAILSVTILFSEVAAGQIAIVQGLRRLKDLAAISMWGATLGTVLSITIVFVLRDQGVVPFLFTVSALSTVCSWWYARKIKLDSVALPFSVVWSESKALIGLGMVFMASGLMTSAVAYITRVMVIRHMDLDAAGLYQAAWILSSTYVGFVMGAMGADYFPRLAASVHDHGLVNRLANEQTEVALYLAVPGILATLTFAPSVIHLFYSAQFEPAGEILRWQMLGIFGRVISWPISFILPAKGCSRIFFFTELGANAAHLALLYWGMKWFGLKGLGMAFFGMYLFYTVCIAFVVRRLTGFFWTNENLRLGLGATLAIAVVFSSQSAGLPQVWIVTVGSLITVAAALYGLRKLAQRAGCASIGDVWVQLRIYCGSASR